MNKTVNDYMFLFQDLHLFLKTKLRNKWIQNDVIKLYVRKSQRSIEGKVYDFFDFASIEIINEDDRGNGYFTNFLFSFMGKYPTKNIYIECVLTERFKTYLIKLGFKERDTHIYGEGNLYLLK